MLKKYRKRISNRKRQKERQPEPDRETNKNTYPKMRVVHRK